MNHNLKVGQLVYVQHGLSLYGHFCYKFGEETIKSVGRKWFTLDGLCGRFNLKTRFSDGEDFKPDAFAWLSKSEYEQDQKLKREIKVLNSFFSDFDFSKATDVQHQKAFALMADLKGSAA